MADLRLGRRLPDAHDLGHGCRLLGSDPVRGAR
jgi:hypothetical protein